MDRKPLIHICDDDEEDQFLIRDAFEQTSIDADFQFTSDGKELTEYLQKTGECPSIPSPDIILLDINMPLMNGLQTLEWIKSRAQFRSIPVVMYTTSSSQKDVDQCYQTGAHFYMTKCSSYDGLVEKVKFFACHWTSVTEHPRRPACEP
jgi:CheY-like chemotaxis protein